VQVLPGPEAERMSTAQGDRFLSLFAKNATAKTLQKARLTGQYGFLVANFCRFRELLSNDNKRVTLLMKKHLGIS
jgi:hypothetical protein